MNMTNGTFTVNQLSMGTSKSAKGILNLSGGTLNVSGTGSFMNVGLRGGDVNASLATVNVTNGTLNVPLRLTLGAYSSGGYSQGIINQFGGTVYAPYIQMTQPSADADNHVATYNLNGGTLINSIIVGATNSSTGLNYSTNNFNGGTLKAADNTTNWIQGLTACNVQNGGAIIDTVGYNVTIAQPLLHYPGATTDGLTKLGTGTLTLAAANTYAGITTISNGTLMVNGSLAAGSAVTVLTNATLGGTGAIGGSVTFNSGAVALFTNGSPLTISGALIASGNVVQLNLSNNVPVGSYTLATYNTSGSSGTFSNTPTIVSGSLAANTHATIVTSSGSVVLQVAANIATTTTTLATSVSPSIYGQSVTFTATVKTNGVAAANATSNYVFKVDGIAIATNAVASGVATYTVTGLTVTTHTIAAEYQGDANYTPSTNSLSQAVNPAPLGVTADSTNKVYTGAAFSGGAGVTYAGFVNGETNTVLGGGLTYGGTAQGATNTGTYTIVPSGLTSTNYAITYTNGTLTISQANTFIGASSTKNPSGYQDSVSYTATLPADATGSVAFSSTNGVFSTNSVSGGTTTSLSITNLPRGTNVITITYSGDGNYIGSTNTLNQIVTNHPPTAAVMTVTRTAGLALIISLSDVATNWSDVDGDTVKLTSVTMLSTNDVNLMPLSWSTNLDGSIVTTNARAYIGYTNSPNVNDQISYSLSDGQGGTNIGYINIVITNSVTGMNSITAHNFSSPYSNTVTAYGIPYYYYILERATNLTAPVWVAVQTNQAATNGIINAADTFWDLGGVKPAPSAFYQLKWQPQP
jgi:autotransporter-associated beta strand protein